MLNEEMLEFETCFHVSFFVMSNRTLWLHYLTILLKKLGYFWQSNLLLLNFTLLAPTVENS